MDSIFVFKPLMVKKERAWGVFLISFCAAKGSVPVCSRYALLWEKASKIA